MLKCNAERIRKNIETLAGFTRTPGQGCTRLSYTKEFREVGHYIIEEMQSAGLTVREDAAAAATAWKNGIAAIMPAR